MRSPEGASIQWARKKGNSSPSGSPVPIARPRALRPKTWLRATAWK